MAELYAWASYMNPLMEHAYVTSSAGHRWPCFGGTDRGRPIGSGLGHPEVAQCLSLPDSEAGINYGLTGVCHQAANRILWPAKVLVSQARSYNLSVMIYGAYGTPNERAERKWRERIGQCSAAQDKSASQISFTWDGDNPPAVPSADQEYAEKLIRLHLQAGERGPVELLARETALLIDYRLPGTGSQLVRTVQDIQRELLAEKKTLDKVLLRKHVGGEKYAAEVNDLINQELAQFLELLGAQYYEQLFGLKPGERCDLVVPEIAAESFR
ncbi:MAG: hypothetical protein RDU41_07995 [Clostridia bacterium]|nr:hypothetical protein [Clostridia bacterium]